MSPGSGRRGDPTPEKKSPAADLTGPLHRLPADFSHQFNTADRILNLARGSLGLEQE
jgi:hypothetical protein